MMQKKFFAVMLLIAGCLSSLSAIEFKQDKDVLTFKTKRMEVKVRNARIIGVKNLQNGVVIADATNNNPAKIAGIGNMTGNPQQMSKIHFPWGEPNMRQHGTATNVIKKGVTVYRYADDKSKLTVKKDGKFVKAVWTDLTNGQKRFPNDRIEMDIFEDENGAFASLNRGFSAEKGVFGLHIPIENFNGSGNFVLPSFGGIKYKASGSDAMIGFQDTGLFYEAKFMAYEYNNTSLGFWYEDSTARPYFIMFGRGKNSSSFGIEINTLMPFEARNSVETPTMKIDSFADADWVAAATPYRNYYRKTFADDLKRRDSIQWANKIYAIADSGVGSDDDLNHVKKLFKPEHVLLHVWQARKLGFTTNIPDYTLRENYPAEVARAHKHGFKVMCYVCSLCAVYKSPQWEKDNVGSFFLTRKNGISNYRGNKNVFDENLMGTLTAAKGSDQFGHLKKGAFLYGDPLSKGWRDYFVNICRTLNGSSGTDANYQDTLGCTSENGNGVIDGLSGAQGNSALARDLAKAMPNTPMASEFGPEPIAFAVKWPLNYPQVWGNKAFRRYRMHNQVPLSVYLFGYRTWIPTINAGDDFHKHLLVACSDGSGGLGMFTAAKGADIKSGFADHMVWRAKIFADNELEPYYPAKKFPKNITAMFKTKNGEIFSYFDDGKLQMMLDGKGKPLYGRVDSMTFVKTKDLKLPGWPCYDENGIYGLNPKNSYALFPANDEKTEISFSKLPEGVMLRYYYTTPDYAYIEFTGNGNIDLQIKYPDYYKELYVNDAKVSNNKVQGTLPVRVFLTNGKAFEATKTLRVANSNGLQSGKAAPLHHLKRYHANQILHYLHGFNSVFMDSVFDVKNADDAVEMYLRNVQEKYGNGTIISVYINGVKKASLDCCSSSVTRDSKRKGKPVWDTKLRKWTFPVGEYKGKRILFSVRVDNKASNNADMQFASTPRMVKQAEQKFTETFPPLANTAPRPAPKRVIVRPAGAPEAVKNYAVAGKAEGTVFAKETKFLNTAMASSFITIDPAKRYVLVGKFRNGSAAKAKTFYYGIIQYDKNMRQIYGGHVNVVKNTESRLSHGVKKGATKIMVRDASNWIPGAYAGFGEMPCRDQFGPVVSTEQYGGDWGVYLKNPVKKDIESDSVVAQYRPASTHKYVYAGRPGKDFNEVGEELKFFKGAVKFQIVLLGQTPTEYKDLKLEIYPAAK